MIDAEIDGLILWHGEVCAVRLVRCLLVLDAVSWARWIAGKKREEATRCERDGGIRTLAEISQQIREIDRWLVTGRGLCKNTHVLYRRQLFHGPVITAAAFERYIMKLLRFRIPPLLGEPSEFVLDADAEPPTLYVLDDMSAAAQHTGPFVLGRVVDRREMIRMTLSGRGAAHKSGYRVARNGQ